MAYDVPADYIDENLAMAESTAIFYVKQFSMTMVEVFGPQYLRAPNAQDTQRLLEMNKARGFPGMLGSVDCMHWKWKNCPKAWHGQFKGRGKDATIIRQLLIIKHGFGMHILGCLDLAATSTCSTGHLCSPS